MEIIMKKKIALLAATAMVAGMLTGCSKDATYVSEIDAADYVTLGEYKGIEVSLEEASVDEAEVDSYIQYLLSMNAETVEVTDRAVENGDVLNIDYTGYQDGVAFDGGTAQGQSLTIGSGQFIPGFEEGLIGANIGDEVTLDLTFPEDYWNEEMAGAVVTFEVKVNGISTVTVPELNDEYVQGLGLEGVSTVQEYRDYVYEQFYAQAVSEYNTNLKNEILDTVVANCVFKEIPEKMIERYYNVVEESMTSMASLYYGTDLANYMQSYYGMEEAAYQESFTEQATLMAQRYIMFQAIADVEGLNMTDEEMAQALEEQALSYGYESVEQFKEENDAGTYEEYLMGDEVMAFLIDNAVITNTTAATEETATEETTTEDITTEETTAE